MLDNEKSNSLEAVEKIVKIFLFGVDYSASDEMLQEVKDYAEYVKYKHGKD